MEEKTKKKINERLKEHFRLIILNEDSLKEIGSYRINLLNIYLLLSIAFIVIGAIVASIIFFTPFRTIVPGYRDINANKDFIELVQKTKEMENQILALNEYIERSKKRLSGVEGEPIQENSSTLNIESQVPINMDSEEKGSSAARLQNTPGIAKLGQYYLLAPINGPISADFDPKNKHFGVDILGPKNTAVKAIMDGIVISADWTLETGNTIAIQHSNNIVSFYKHNSALLKKAGSFVEAGEAIAIIGNTGTLSDGPHLHFELWYNGHPVNPTEFINF